jgi:hypothetical protein
VHEYHSSAEGILRPSKDRCQPNPGLSRSDKLGSASPTLTHPRSLLLICKYEGELRLFRGSRVGYQNLKDLKGSSTSHLQLRSVRGRGQSTDPKSRTKTKRFFFMEEMTVTWRFVRNICGGFRIVTERGDFFGTLIILLATFPEEISTCWLIRTSKADQNTPVNAPVLYVCRNHARTKLLYSNVHRICAASYREKRRESLFDVNDMFHRNTCFYETHVS